MVTNEMIRAYDEYLHSHISNVRLGFEWLLINLPELLSEYDAETIAIVSLNHDSSKWSDEEYLQYVEYFNGEKTDEVKEQFDYAWLHHQHNNPHHWQYWCLREDDGGLKPLKMPKLNVIEMLMDWWAFSWKSENLYEIFNWYDKNKEKIVLHDETKKFVEDTLELLKSKLDEVHTNGN